MLANKELYEHTAQKFSLMLMHLKSMTLLNLINATLKFIIYIPFSTKFLQVIRF